ALISTRSVSAVGGGPYAYVANYTVGTLSVLDTSTNAIVATTSPQLGSGVLNAPVLVNTSGTRAVVAGNGIYVYDTSNSPAAPTLLFSLPTVFAPIALSPDGTRLYSFVSGGFNVYDMTTGATVSSTVVAWGGSIDAIALTPDGGHAYISINNQ